MPWSGKHGLITRVYLQQFGTVEHAVQFALFVSMVLHATYPQTGFPAAVQPLHLALAVKLWLNNTFLWTHAPFRSFAFLLDLGIELTENQCQSVKPLSRPTWVLGVILRKEAPLSFRNSCN